MGVLQETETHLCPNLLRLHPLGPPSYAPLYPARCRAILDVASSVGGLAAHILVETINVVERPRLLQLPHDNGVRGDGKVGKVYVVDFILECGNIGPGRHGYGEMLPNQLVFLVNGHTPDFPLCHAGGREVVLV